MEGAIERLRKNALLTCLVDFVLVRTFTGRMDHQTQDWLFMNVTEGGHPSPISLQKKAKIQLCPMHFKRKALHQLLS
jgi:hypothetical protein